MAAKRAMADDPIDDRLLEGFYIPQRLLDPSSDDEPNQPPAATTARDDLSRRLPARSVEKPRAVDKAVEKPRPTHYKICCISLYTEDIARLEAMVAELKRRGHSKANKSQLIRAALDQVDLSRIPKAP